MKLIWCWLFHRMYWEWIPAENYNPPQLAVAGCHRCSKCKQEHWV